MNAERFLEHYDRIADAPDALPRLRRFILDLAVRGKLVPQDPNEEPFDKFIHTESNVRGRSQRSAAFKDRLPLDAPAGWVWLKLLDVGSMSGGMTPSKGRSDFWNGDVPWISSKDVKSDELFDSELQITSAALAESTLKLYPSGCVIIVARSGILKRTLPVAINRVPVTVNQDLKVLVPFQNGIERYIQLMLRGLTDFILRDLVKTGTTVQSLKYDEFAQQRFPFPPLAEQQRIVAKVDALMALCDRLEAERAEREAVRDRLTAASFTRLGDPDPDTLQDDARFALDALPTLTARAGQVSALRTTILDLAVRGMLVPQDSNDEPVHSELDRSRFEHASFSLPASWAWVTVGGIAESRLGKMLDKAKNKGTPRRYLRNVNVRWFDFDLSDVLEMRFEDSELQEFELRPGDVLICEGGEPGRAAVWDGREAHIYFQKALHRIRFGDSVASDYFVLALRQSVDDGRLAQSFTGTGIKHFTGKSLSAYRFPLPPLPEQQRIVAKVDALMALCDRLEACLSNGAVVRSRLLDALIADALVSEESQEMRNDADEDEMPEVTFSSPEEAAAFLDMALPLLRQWARDTDESGRANPVDLQRRAINSLLETREILDEAQPSALRTLIEFAFSTPDEGNLSAIEARESAREGLVSRNILTQEEVDSLTYIEAAFLVRQRTGIDF